MKLLNFDLEPGPTITLQGLGYEWDLHNFAAFQGFAFAADSDSLSLSWEVAAGLDNPWGSRGNLAVGCSLVFSGVTLLKLSDRDAELPASEEVCLSAISKVDPNETEYRWKDTWTDDADFNLLFELQSGRTLEIAAMSAELRARDPARS